jgi:large repetitive protein
MPKRRFITERLGLAIECWLLLCAAAASAQANKMNTPPSHDQRFFYTNDVEEQTPLSIHIVKIERSHPELQLCTSLGDGQTFGMATVSEQIKRLPRSFGRPLAAINGDFWDTSKYCKGRPRDLQVWNGEVVSSPAGDACFWMDANGRPHMTNVFSAFRVIWADGKTVPIGLNQDRAADAAVLYTSVVGASTHTHGGVDLVLQPATNGVWLPLKIGQVYSARVGSLAPGGNAPLTRHNLVLSIGPELLRRVPACRIGTRLRVVTDTIPDLTGVKVAIGGGPALVHEGRVMQWEGFIHARHPRSAVGWNKDYIYLVEVDGRQNDLSIGMTFPEFASYLARIGCQEAMNFDGGGSATMWVLGDVRNSPSEGRERPAPNALVIVLKQRVKK